MIKPGFLSNKRGQLATYVDITFLVREWRQRLIMMAIMTECAFGGERILFRFDPKFEMADDFTLTNTTALYR